MCVRCTHCLHVKATKPLTPSATAQPVTTLGRLSTQVRSGLSRVRATKTCASQLYKSVKGRRYNAHGRPRFRLTAGRRNRALSGDFGEIKGCDRGGKRVASCWCSRAWEAFAPRTVVQGAARRWCSQLTTRTDSKTRAARAFGTLYQRRALAVRTFGCFYRCLRRCKTKTAGECSLDTALSSREDLGIARTPCRCRDTAVTTRPTLPVRHAPSTGRERGRQGLRT